MFAIHGYKTHEELYESAQSLIFRAVREADDAKVILKVLKDVHPTPERLARFKREYQLVKALDLAGVVKVYDFASAANHWLFVQEDFGGESLARLGLAGKVEIGEALAIAEAVAGHVAAVHQQGVIHKDINPSNIVLDRRSGVVKLIDFGISTRLSRETVAFDHVSLIEGTPAYLSPEQTGRINQPLDHRTDLYSLGCTLYELVTGRLPFEATDLIELLHCHIARTPEPPHVLRPEVPPALSAIIHKLMAKNAADRYQSARGVEADLTRAKRAWSAGGAIELFTPGQDDVAQRLLPPSRLYGRDKEVGQLVSTFERVAGGAAELLLVSGHSGVGKSALIKELYRPVTQGHGFFAAGKFDQFQRGTPYRPILEALDGLIGQVLMEPPARLASWAAAVQAAAGKMLSSLAEILPRLELLYDQLPPAPVMPAAEANHRFIEALTGFIRVFARAEHPLVLFIDDLQWADGASLDLLKHLMIGAPIPHLLILGAYRDHEVAAAHPLRAALADIRAAGVQVREQHVSPLNPEDTAALVADTLHRDVDSAREASNLVHDKTGGNPFFIHTFLDAMVARDVVFFDHDTGGFRWHIDRLRVLDLSDNVVDLVLASMREMPSQTRDLLAQAACIGNHFELGLLAAVAGRAAGDAAADLMPALIGNYLIPTTGDYRLLEAGVEGLNARLDVAYKFAHDRIQQAAYGLSAPEAHAAIHLRIGRAMRAYYTGKAAESQLLAMADQLNQARLLIEDEGEIREIAALNLEAGRKARAAVANAAALDYFERGLAFLAGPSDGDVHERAFHADYALSVALAEGAADAAYLVPDFAAMDRHVDAILRHGGKLMDRIKALLVRINAQVAQYQSAAAIVTAREIFEPLGIELPSAPTSAEIDATFDLVAREMRGRSPHDLADLPKMSAPDAAAALAVLDSIFVPAFLTQPALSPLVAAQMVLLTLRHGLGEESVNGFVFYGLSLCARERIELGYEFGRVAEQLIERDGRKTQFPCLMLVGNAYVFHWRRPLRDAVQKMRDGYRSGLESGNISWAANCLQCSSAMGFLSGRELASVDKEYAEADVALEKHKQGPFLIWLRQYHQAVLNFRGLNDDPTLLRGAVYDEVSSRPVHERSGDLTSIYMLHFNKGILCYHFHNHQEALRCSRVIEKGNQPGSSFSSVAIFYHGLSLLATSSDTPPEGRAALLEEASGLVLRMKRWGEECPVNYAHKYHLMAAELARVEGKPSEARDHYDMAIDLAHEHEFLQEEGLAQERAALFFLERNNPRLAGHYMRDAYYTYGVWGAVAKRDFLRKRFGYLLEREAGKGASKAISKAATATTSTTEIGDLDLGTVIAATRAITRETNVQKLLEAVMRASLENAGAERGFLVLARGGELIVKVRGELGDEAKFASMSIALHDQEGIARSVVHYVARTAEPVLLANAAGEGMFTQDPHVLSSACKSLLCVPILYQGRLMAVSYLENSRAAGVFNEDRLTVLTLLMGQAAVSIENALLKESSEVRDMHFKAGGSLPADSPAYVRREADTQLADNVRRGELSYVLNTRQMGKSSLRVRAADQLGKAGFACASIDLTAIGASDVSAEQWYAGVARAVVTGLGLQNDVDLRRFWRDHADLSPVQRLTVLFDEVILTHVNGSIVIFVDEVDAVLGLPFSPDDFFAMIRLFYNRRAEDPRYARLTFVLLGVATPADLIRDKRRTPFNIGGPVSLAGFRFDEAHNLASGLAHVGDGEALLRAVLDWSGGQPFLTQKLCRLIVEAESRPPAGRERAWVTELVQQRVIDQWRHRDEPEHLRTIEARVLHPTHDVEAALSLYRRVLEAGEIDAGDSPEESALLLSGLVTRAFDKLRVTNPIYAAVFGEPWIREALAKRAAHP